MFLEASAPAQIAGSTGRVGNVVQSPHLPTGRPNAVVEAELRNNWKAELAAQEPALREPVAHEQTGLQLSNSSPASSPAESLETWSDRQTGEIQSGLSQLQTKAEDENFSENPHSSGNRTDVAKSSRVPNAPVNPALVSEKISGRVASRDLPQLTRPQAAVTSRHDASTSLASPQTGSVKHSRHASPTVRDWRAGSSQKFQVSLTSSLQVNPSIAAIEAVTARMEESGAFGGGRLAQVDEDSSSGLRQAASVPQPGSANQASEDKGSARDGSPLAMSNISRREGSNLGITLAAGSTGPIGIAASYAAEESSRGISGAVASALFRPGAEDVRNPRVLADDEVNESAASTAIRSNGLVHGGLDAPLLLSTTMSSRVGLPEGSSSGFPATVQSAMVQSPTEAGSLPANPAGTGIAPAIPDMPSSAQLRSLQAARFGKGPTDIKTDYCSSMTVDPSGPSAVSSHAGGTTGVAHASVLASSLAGPVGVPSASGIFSSGGQTGTADIREVSRNPFPALDSFGTTDATDATSRLHGAQINSQSVAGRSLSSGQLDGVRALEMGYQDPVLGYVELRAHTEGAGIHASLTAQSADSGAALEAHLSSLTNWMNERRTPVESLTVTSFLQGHAGESGHSGHSQPDAQGDARDRASGDQHPISIWGAGESSTSNMRSMTGSIAGSGSSRTSGSVTSLTEGPQSELETSGSNISVVA
jgi:hypothetical protein